MRLRDMEMETVGVLSDHARHQRMAIHRTARFDLQQARQHHLLQLTGLYRNNGIADHLRKGLLCGNSVMLDSAGPLAAGEMPAIKAARSNP